LIPDLGKIGRAQLKHLRNQKLFLATPMYGGKVMGNYELAMASTMRWAGILGLDVRPMHLFGATYIDVGRNYLANGFWESNCTHLIFLDADQGWTANHLFELVLCTEPGRQIVAGLYPRRKINWENVRKAVLSGVPTKMLEHCSGDFPMHALPGHDIAIGNEPQKVLSMPTGFMCITRKCLEMYVEAFPNRKTTPGNPGHFGIEFFRAGVQEVNGSRGADSEDNIFCKDMLTLGVNTWFCPWMHITHFGEHLFQACLPCSLGMYGAHMDLEDLERRKREEKNEEGICSDRPEGGGGGERQSDGGPAATGA
jgi:hypothetical protein